MVFWLVRQGEASDTIMVSCEVDDKTVSKLTVESINVGDRVVCSGKLGGLRFSLFGMTAVNVVDATINRQTARRH